MELLESNIYVPEESPAGRQLMIARNYAVAVAAVLGVGPFSAPIETPELRNELAKLRRYIRMGAPDRKIITAIRRITVLRTRQSRALRQPAAVRRALLS